MEIIKSNIRLIENLYISAIGWKIIGYIIDVIKVIGFLTNNFGSDNIKNIGSIISRYAYLTSYIDKIDRRLKPKLDYNRKGKEWINSIYITVQAVKSKLKEYIKKIKANIYLYYIPTLLLPFPYGGSSP